MLNSKLRNISLALIFAIAFSPVDITHAVQGNTANEIIHVVRQARDAIIAYAKTLPPSLVRHLDAIELAVAKIDQLADGYAQLKAVSEVHDVEGYFEVYGSANHADDIARANRLNNRIKRINANLPEIRPVEFTLAVYAVCEESKASLSEIIDAKIEMEKAERSIENKISSLRKIVANAKWITKRGEAIQSRLLKVAEEVGPAIGTVTHSGTIPMASLFSQSEQFGKWKSAYGSLNKSGTDLLVRLRQDLNTIQGNLKVLNDLSRGTCEHDKDKEEEFKSELEVNRLDNEIERLMAEAELAEVSGNIRRQAELDAEMLRIRNQRFKEWQRKNELRIKRQRAEAKSQAEATARIRAEEDAAASQFIQGLLGAVTIGLGIYNLYKGLEGGASSGPSVPIPSSSPSYRGERRGSSGSSWVDCGCNTNWCGAPSGSACMHCQCVNGKPVPAR